MKINIVTVDSGWILQQIANRIKKTNENIFSLTCWEPKLDVDANFYVDIQNCYRGPTSTLDIGCFTHLDKDSTESLSSHWLTIDYIIHQCTRYYDIFSDFYDQEKMKVVPLGQVPDGFTPKKPVIGIFQRGGFEGKGYFFMQDIAKQYPEILRHFKFVFVGKNWDGVISALNNQGVKTFKYDDTDYSVYPKIYRNVDYVLIPSLWEGGPMSVIEAGACGIPVISAKVGYLDKDFDADYLFEPGNKEQLIQIFEKILQPIKKRRKQVSSLSYKKYGEELITIVQDLNKDT